jgi:hypothetical protein
MNDDIPDPFDGLPYFKVYAKDSRWSRWRWIFSTTTEADLNNTFAGWGRGQEFTSYYAIKVLHLEGTNR